MFLPLIDCAWSAVRKASHQFPVKLEFNPVTLVWESYDHATDTVMYRSEFPYFGLTGRSRVTETNPQTQQTVYRADRYVFGQSVYTHYDHETGKAVYREYRNGKNQLHREPDAHGNQQPAVLRYNPHNRRMDIEYWHQGESVRIDSAARAINAPDIVSCDLKANSIFSLFTPKNIRRAQRDLGQDFSWDKVATQTGPRYFGAFKALREKLQTNYERDFAKKVESPVVPTQRTVRQDFGLASAPVTERPINLAVGAANESSYFCAMPQAA